MRAHPVYIYSFLKRFLFVLILPVLKGLIQYIFYRRVSGVLLLEGIALGLIILLSVIKLLSFGISVSSEELCIKEGLFFRKTAVIQRKSLSNITFTRHFLLDLVGAVGVSVNTEAGSYGKRDFKFKLSKQDAKRLEDLVYGRKPQIELRFPVRRIALVSASTSSAITGLVVGVPVINRIGKLLNIGLLKILNDISGFSIGIKTYFSPAVNTATVILLVIYGISFIIALERNFFFRVSTDPEKIEVMSGLYFRRKRIFRKRDINDICIDQTPLMRIFKTGTMRVSIGGYGGEKGERATIVPAMRRNHIKRRFAQGFPILGEGGDFVKPEKSGLTRRRFLLLPNVYAVSCVAILGSLTLMFPAFERLTSFILLVLLIFDCFYAYISVGAMNFSGISLGETVAVRTTARFTERELFVKSDKIGIIKVIKTPADIKYGTCKLRLTVRSESSDSVKVRNIPFSPIKEKINEVYGIMI